LAFRFPLESLLQLWRSRHRQERRKLESAGARLAALRTELNRVEENRLRSRRATENWLGEGATAAELHFVQACEGNRQAFLAWLREQVKSAEAEHRKQMAVYQGVERQCKIFENLRNRQYEVYRRDEDRREQRRLDEVFLLGYAAAERGRTEAAPDSN
jgi:flagellar export protein FliJ